MSTRNPRQTTIGDWTGKHFFAATELTKLPGMPQTVAEIKKLARQQGWRCRPYAGNPEYYFGDFPRETKEYFLAKQEANQFQEETA
ncbi:MAG: hypothetical protein KME13_23960 [Myxacorys californica WJT36-NPBG1]|jgi:hypothetical protein|nr:hypothetical protein [Myxacorys californica WJT36-NPBG1]